MKSPSTLQIALFSCLVAFSLLQGCKKYIINKPVMSDELEVDKLDFAYLSIKSKLNFDDGINNVKAIADFRLRKDSIIWVSMRHGTGIEGVRTLITPDSVFMINRLEKNYYAFSYKDLFEQLKFKFSFDLLQSSILGEVPKELRTRTKAKRSGAQYIVENKVEKYDVLSYFSMVYGRLTRISIDESESTNSMEITYSNFQEVKKDKVENNNQNFPHLMSARLDYTRTEKSYHLTLEVEHKKVEIEEKPIRFPFNISDRYKKVGFLK